MTRPDEREKHLGWIEVQLRRDHPEFPHLQITADTHYGSFNHFAWVRIWGVKDRGRRKEIREQAEELVRRLGYEVGCFSGLDTYELYVQRPQSAHEEIEFQRSLNTALAKSSRPNDAS